MKPTLGLVGLSLMWSALAAAEPQFADDWYKEGEDRYNLGEFDKAADAFKRGFALEPNDSKKPAYMYNVAQAYRQANECKDAVFFYKRFLSLKDSGMGKPLSDGERKDIESVLGQLDACAKQQDTVAPKPTSPHGEVATAKAGSAGGDDDDDDTVRPPVAGGPKLVAASVELGGSKIMAGGLDVPLQPAFALTAGYPIAIDARRRIDVGVAFGLESIPYTNSITNQSEAGSLTHLLANVGGTYTVAPKIAVRGDLGLGVMLLDGLEHLGNPFTPAGESATGALAMFAIRAAVSGEYELTPNIVGTVTPLAFTYSPARSGLRSDITSITGVDFLIGVGYRR
jgi:hypothetical protein